MKNKLSTKLSLLVAILLVAIPASVLASTAPPVDMFQLPWEQGKAWYPYDGLDNGLRRSNSSPHYFGNGGALDFAPRATMTVGEDTSNDWVTAAAAGTVYQVGSCFIKIDHGNGWTTEYWHLDKIQVTTGSKVSRNQRLATIHNNKDQQVCPGNEFPGPHLHFVFRPSVLDTRFAGWTVNFNLFTNITTFTKSGQTVGRLQPLMNIPGMQIANRGILDWNILYEGNVDAYRQERWSLMLIDQAKFDIKVNPTAIGLVPVIVLLDASGNEITRANGTLSTTQPAGFYYVDVRSEAGTGYYNIIATKIESGGATVTPSPTSTGTSTSTQIPTVTTDPGFSTVTPSITLTPTVTDIATGTPDLTQTANAAGLTATANALTQTANAATLTASANSATQTASALTQTPSAATLTAVADFATQTANAATLTATANSATQTAIAITQTVNSTTQTAVAATLTATSDAATQTAMALTQTPNAATQTAMAGTATSDSATQTAVAATLTANPVILTAIASTQTANAATQTALVATLTAEPAIQTAIAATQTANALTMTASAITPSPTITQTSVPTPVGSYVLVDVIQSTLTSNQTSLVNVSLNNVPPEGFSSAEFVCTYNPAIVEVSNILAANLFGSDPATALSGPQNGEFILAIAGTNNNKATSSGTAFTFSVRGLQVGQTTVQCTARVSTGQGALQSIGYIPDLVTVIGSTMSPTPVGSAVTGRVIASKPVTIRMYDAGNTLVISQVANQDGTFALQVPSGTYTIIASADGYLNAQGFMTLSNGQTIIKPPINLPAGDIDGNSVIDQFDALTIGMNYGGSFPAAADLNNDGVINVLDLELLAANYRLSGALSWQ